MLYSELIEPILRWTSLGELTEYGRVQEQRRAFPLYKLTVPGPKWLTVTAGFHGDEQAGPLTLRERMEELCAYARAKGVGLRVYPCLNPSGFEARTRYNASGERPNNDLLRYEVAQGVLKGELAPNETFLRWHVYRGGPKETQLLRASLEKDSTPVAALDLHQDPTLRGRFVYAYTFGDRAPYRALLSEATRWGQIAQSTLVDESQALHTDDDGLIEYHDGSVTDYFMRRGARYTAALETTLDTTIESCLAINALWIRGFIDLAAGS